MFLYAGALDDVILDDEQKLQAIAFQDQEMVNGFDAFPELLCLDGTYKLNNLDITVFALTVVDGNEETVVVGLWFAVNDEK